MIMYIFFQTRNSFHISISSQVLNKIYLSLFWAKMAVFVAENKLDGIEEVGLSRAIAADDHIVAGVKRLNNRLLPIGLEALDDHLLDEHPGTPAREKALCRL